MERTISFTLNGKTATVKADDERMLLWVLRSDLGLTGTKFGCGEGLCGACTVIVENEAVRSCVTPLKAVAGKQVLTIEGIGQNGLHAIQQGFLESPRVPVRILHAGNDPERVCAAAEDAASHARADCAAHGGQSVPLRLARAHSGCDSGSRRGGKGRCVMAENVMATGGMKRRDFFGVAGAGLFVFFSADLAEAQEPARLPGRQSGPTDLNAYLKIGADGRVTCLAGKVELGQGAMTELALALAEELDVALDTVDVVMGDTDLCPYDMGTFGSMCYAAALARGAKGRGGGQSGIGSDGVGAVEGAGRTIAGSGGDHPRIGQAVECGDLRATGGRQAHRAAPGECAREGGGVPGDRHVAAAQGRPGQGHGPGEIRRRHAASGAAARGHSAAAGARGEAEIGGHFGGGEGERRAGGEGRRDDRGAA